MSSVIGFEGTVSDLDVVSYGAAAILNDAGLVLNSFTGSKQLRSELSAPGESLTLFKTPWDSSKFSDDLELVVVAIRANTLAWDRLLIPDPGRIGGCLGKKREKPFVYIAFRDRDAFRLYAREASGRCADAVLREEWKTDALAIIRSGLVLSPRDPLLLALRAYHAPDRALSTRTAETLLQKADELTRRRFSRYLAALVAPKDSLYSLKYEDGDQSIGGMNIDASIVQLNAIESIAKKLRPALVASIDAVAEEEHFPEPRFQYLKAASAEFGFGILGKDLRERFLRYLELESLGRALRGDIPAELAKDSEFMKEVRSVLAPPGGAYLRHRPLGAEDLEAPAVEFVEEQEVLQRSSKMTVAGFIQGFYREVRKAEIRLGNDHAELVSVEVDDRGKLPGGVEHLREGRGLFVPTIVRLVRHEYSSGRIKYYLRELVDVEAGEVDTLPSGVVRRGLFQPGNKARADLNLKESLSIFRSSFNLERAKEWLRDWQTRSIEVELAATENTLSQWFGPVSRDFALKRILYALGGPGRSMAVDEIVKEISGRYRQQVRINNTRREIRAHLELFEVVADDETDELEQVSLSSRGCAWLAVLQRYAGY